jgi:hypothetical protein
MELSVEEITGSSDKIFLACNDSIYILPNNFLETNNTEEYFYSSTLPTVKKLLSTKNIPVKILGKESDQIYIEQRGLEYFLPIFFIGSLYYSQNPTAVSIALGMIANYLTEIFKGQKEPKVNLNIYIRDDINKITKRVKYKGTPEGLKDVDKIVKNTMKDFGAEKK